MSIKPRKVLIINDTVKFYGGAESYMYALKKLLEQYKYKVKIIGGQTGLSLFDSFFSRWFSYKYYKLTKKSIIEFKPDIIHVQSFARVISPSILIAAYSFKIPVIQTVHDYHYICPKLWMIDDNNKNIKEHNSFTECLFHHLPKKNLIYSLLQSTKTEFHKIFLKKYVNTFICPSLALTNFYSKRYGSNNVKYVSNFVNETIYRYSKIKNFNNLVFIGRFNKEKGVDILLKAFNIVLKEIPKAELIIIGNGPEKNNLVNLCNKLNILDNVHWVDLKSQSEITNYYRQATSVIIPSVWIENCPMVALEAISSGRPVIASNAGGLKELVINNKTGLLFERTSVNDLAEKIIKLLKNEKLIKNINKHLATQGRAFHKKEHFTKIQDIYDIVLNK